MEEVWKRSTTHLRVINGEKNPPKGKDPPPEEDDRFHSIKSHLLCRYSSTAGLLARSGARFTSPDVILSAVFH